MSAARRFFGPIGKQARIVFGFWLFESALALFVAFPIHAAVARAYGSHPEGDAVLFHPGSLELMDLVFRFDLSLSAIPVLLVVSLFAAAVVGHLPLAAALGELAGKGAIWTRAVSAFPRMLLVFALSALVRGLVAIAAIFAAIRVQDALASSQGEAASYVWALATIAPFAFVLLTLTVILDYVYAFIAKDRGLARPFSRALASFRRRKLASLLNWLARGVASLFLLLLGSAVARAFGGEGGAALFVLFIVHQAVTLSRITLRVNWLAYIVRASAETVVALTDR